MTIMEIGLVFSLEVKLELGTCDGFWLGYEVGIELMQRNAFSNLILQIYIVTSFKENIFSFGSEVGVLF